MRKGSGEGGEGVGREEDREGERKSLPSTVKMRKNEWFYQSQVSQFYLKSEEKNYTGG